MVDYGINKKECYDCDRSENRKCQLDAAPDNIEPGGILIIGSYPEQEAAEMNNKIHFYQERRLILDETLLQKYADIEPYIVAYTYACHCRVRGMDKGPVPIQVKACKYRVWAEIRHYKPKLIIAMGKEAMSLFKGTDKGVKHTRGTGEVYTDDVIGSVIVCYTLALNVFDPDKSSSATDTEDTKRDERKLMYSDFEWIGKVYRDTKQLYPQQFSKIKTNYRLMKVDDTKDEYKKVFNTLKSSMKKRRCTYDVETRSLKDRTILCISFSYVAGVSYVFPLLQERVDNQIKIDMCNNSIKKGEDGKSLIKDGKVQTSLRKKNGELSKRGEMHSKLPDYLGEEYIIKDKNVRKYVLDNIKSILENPEYKKVAQNGCFDNHCLRRGLNINVQGWEDDTMLMYSMIDEESVRGLKALADMYIPRLRGYEYPKFQYMQQYKLKDHIRVSYDMLGIYNAMDTDATLCLYYRFMNTIKEAGDWDFYRYYAMELQKIMYKLEVNGVLIDTMFIKNQEKENIEQMKKLAILMIDFVITTNVKKFKGISYDNINEITGKMDNATEECQEGFKVEGNIDVALVVTDKGVKLEEKTKHGKWVQSGVVLTKFKKDPVVESFIENVIEYREISKKNSFLSKYATIVDERNMIYSDFTVHGAVTGRPTARTPNLLQVPRDSDVKNMIIAPEGYYLVQADLSQAELRILSHYADETSMKQVFTGFSVEYMSNQNGYIFINNKIPHSIDMSLFYIIENLRTGDMFCFQTIDGREDLLYILGKIEQYTEDGKECFEIVSDTKAGNWVCAVPVEMLNNYFNKGDELSTGSGDIHCYIGSQINKIVMWNMTKEQRYEAKSTSFGIPYGMGEIGLSRRLDIPIEEAKVLMEIMFTRFPRIKTYIEGAIQEARISAKSNEGVGIVTTELGRKRHISDIRDSNIRRRSHAERQAVNFKIQGTCQDIVANILIDIDREMAIRKSKALFFNQVYDSMLYYVPYDETEDFVSWVKPVMEKPRLNTDLKFPVDIEVYEKCWGGKKLKF